MSVAVQPIQLPRLEAAAAVDHLLLLPLVTVILLDAEAQVPVVRQAAAAGAEAGASIAV